jgi:hypothetical protein
MGRFASGTLRLLGRFASGTLRLLGRFVSGTLRLLSKAPGAGYKAGGVFAIFGVAISVFFGVLVVLPAAGQSRPSWQNVVIVISGGVFVGTLLLLCCIGARKLVLRSIRTDENGDFDMAPLTQRQRITLLVSLENIRLDLEKHRSIILEAINSNRLWRPYASEFASMKWKAEQSTLTALAEKAVPAVENAYKDLQRLLNLSLRQISKEKLGIKSAMTVRASDDLAGAVERIDKALSVIGVCQTKAQRREA